MKIEEKIFKIQPKIPENLDLDYLKKKVFDYIDKIKLQKPEMIALTGSYVWNNYDSKSDIDILLFGNYDLEDFSINTEIKIIEISTIPINKENIGLTLPYETRWDIISSISLDKENEEKLSKIKKENILKREEIDCMLSHIINRLSWLGIIKKEEIFKNEKICSFLDRYKKNRDLNSYNVLFYCLDLLAIAQYCLNKLPYPFAKWRIKYLDKLKICSEILLEFSKDYNKSCIEIEELLELLSRSFEETIDLIKNLGYLSNGLKNEEECRRKLNPYPYF